MNKTIFSMLVATLVCVAVSTARADDGIASGKLADMGLSSLSMMSDSDALAVRGKGFDGFNGCDGCNPRPRKAPSSAAFGNSFATVAACDGCGAGISHSENGYAAEGTYGAGGSNVSEAGFVKTTVESVVIDGITRSVTTTSGLRVFAGGSSSAMSF
jgi:hypothetical protein